jgi:tRNA(fMet)-specific endonuclease VapC
MLQFLLDTDHLTLLQHDYAPLVQRIAMQPIDAVGICPINIEEVMRGRLARLGHALAGGLHVEAYAHLVAAVEFFRRFPVVPFDDPSEIQFQQLRKARTRVGTLDLKIASVALAHRLTVLTRNRSDFGRVPGLAMEDWSVP